MNVTMEDLRKIPPGQIKAFRCEDGKKLRSAASLISTLKVSGLPENVVDYEHKKLVGSKVILIRPLRKGDEKILNKIKWHDVD